VLVGVPYYVSTTIRQATDRLMSPVEEANAQLKTQVAQFLNPTPTILPDPVTIVHEVRALARLETIQYSIEKVITAEVSQGQLGFLFGDRLLFVAHGTVVAGVDLSKLALEDVKLEGKTVRIRLPEPEVFVTALDNDRSYVYDRETGILRHSDVNLETAARQAAEQEILKSAMEDGILDTARTNAENYLTRLLLSLGYEQAIFEGGASPSDG
ncbi:MAG: DUF4230 domain-containing protein, partial [Chloroflexi bacterium]|nr:DUF4230 domain-containing protein [Chloroflexota bacterium]